MFFVLLGFAALATAIEVALWFIDHDRPAEPVTWIIAGVVVAGLVGSIPALLILRARRRPNS